VKYVGKLSPESLREVLGCIHETVDVVVPPTPGFGAGVHKIGDDLLVVVATDPCIDAPQEHFGWLLINYSASDVAVFGVRPRFCTVNLLGPPGTKSSMFKKAMEQACAAAEELGMRIVTGHTGTYAGVSSLTGTCTAYGFSRESRVITPAGAKPNDLLIVTKPLGLETVVNFVLTRRSLAEALFGPTRVAALLKKVRSQTCVEEALSLAEVGVSAMQDATEGGFAAALNELADASHVGFLVDFEHLPVPPELNTLADNLQLSRREILSASSTGTLLAAVPSSNRKDAIDSLRKLGIDAKTAGVFTRDRRRILAFEGREAAFPTKAKDPYTRILTEPC